MDWYVQIGERQLGPLSEDTLRAMAAAGEIGPDTLLWRAGMTEWAIATSIPGILVPPPVSSPARSTPSKPTSWNAPLSDNTQRREHTPPPANLAAPWPRYWARCLDLLVWTTALFAVLVALVRSGDIQLQIFQPGGLFAGPGGDQLLAWAILPLAIIVDAITYSLFGNTPGKCLAGIKVLDVGGRRLTLGGYLQRNFGMYLNGFGTGFPFVALFTLVSSHRRAVRGELMSWDQSSNARAFAMSTAAGRTWLTAIAYIALTAALGIVGAQQKSVTPPPVESPEQQLQEAATSVNRKTPVMVDNETRLDRAEAGPGLLFTYHYTLMNIRKAAVDPGRLDEVVRGTMRETLRSKVCTSLKSMLDLNATIRYHYLDEDGADLVTLAFSQADCSH